MPQQDYVKTARPSQRARKKPNEKKPLPVVLIAAVVVLLIGFAAFLWHISHRPGADAAAAEALAAGKTETSTQDELPPKPAKEPYTYIKELQTKEIKVEATQLATKAPATMICGTFRAYDGAQQLKAKLAFAGITADIKQISDGRYRVIVGPYVSKRQAQNDKNRLEGQRVANCWVP